MIFSFGGGKRAFAAAAATVALSSALTACSGSDEPSPPDRPSASAATTTATPDEAALDQAALKDLVDRYWAVQTKAQNAGDSTPDQFAPVAKGAFIEGDLKSIRDAKDDDVVRQGAPVVTDVEITITGDKADLRACVNEDDWIFVQGGEDLNFDKLGNGPWGAEATKTGDTWLISDVRLPPKGEKNCP